MSIVPDNPPSDETPLRRLDKPLPWEQQTGEDDAAFVAFVYYRDSYSLTGRRTLARAWKRYLKDGGMGTEESITGKWSRWSKVWCWLERCQAWDAECDRKRRKRRMDALRKMDDRHAKKMEQAFEGLTVPLEIMAETFMKPEVQEELRDLAPLELLEVVTKTMPLIKTAVDIERKARGADVQEAGLVEAEKRFARMSDNELDAYLAQALAELRGGVLPEGVGDAHGNAETEGTDGGRTLSLPAPHPGSDSGGGEEGTGG